MRRMVSSLSVLAFVVAVPLAAADVMVEFKVDAGGNNNQPLNGLAARGTFSVNGTKFTLLLENISTGVPNGFDVADSLLVSVGMNLPAIDFLTGDAAVIGLGSKGLGSWSSRVAGDSVAEEWLWTNEYGGDLMEVFKHVISTSEGQGGGKTTRFDKGNGSVGGPFGGMAAKPPILPVPDNQPAVSNSIRFDLTLTGTLTPEQLRTVAENSIVEFGSDQRYLKVPEPATLALLLCGAAVLRRR